MAEVKKGKWTRGEELLFERCRLPEDGSPIDWPYPSPATLIAADTEDAIDSIQRAAEKGDAIGLFYPNGDEVLLTPSKPA